RAVHDAAGRDYRDVELLHKQSSQSDGSELLVHGVRVEDAAMAACFKALSHHRTDPSRGDGLSLFEIRRRREKRDASSAKGVDPVAGWDAEMKAHDRRFFFKEHPELGVISQKRLIDFSKAGRRFCAVACELGLQASKPCCFTT